MTRVTLVGKVLRPPGKAFPRSTPGHPTTAGVTPANLRSHRLSRAAGARLLATGHDSEQPLGDDPSRSVAGIRAIDPAQVGGAWASVNATTVVSDQVRAE